MQLEKIVTDWYTFYSQPDTLSTMKNCILYISEYNLNMLKIKINNTINDANLDSLIKEMEFEQFKPIVQFVKKHNHLLQEPVMQTEELEFIKENNSYIVVVKDVRDIHDMNESMKNAAIEKAVNDTIFIALSEEAQIITVKDSVGEIISANNIPVFSLNIRLT